MIKMGKLEKEAFRDACLRLETSKERITTSVQPPEHWHMQLSEYFLVMSLVVKMSKSSERQCGVELERTQKSKLRV